MKNLSIKKKIIIAFSIIYLLVNILLLFLNQMFSDDFFIANNFKNMENQVSKKMMALDINNFSKHDFVRMGNELKKDTGSDVYILKNDFSYDHLPKSLEEQLTYVLLNYEYLFTSAKSSGESVKAVIGDGQYINRKILYIKVLPNSDVVVIIKALGMIMEAQELFIKFLALSGILVYCVSIFMVVIFANNFTRPIKQVEETALQISHLNFEDKLDEFRQDEIGSLNKHINQMALKLSTTISALNESNQKLTNELNKERNMEAMREQFVSDVSHELKNPISMIIGYAEGIKRGLAKTEEDKAFYNQVILEEGERMNKLVEELLDLSSYRAGSITLEKEMIQLGDLITQSLDKYTMIQNKKDISVILDIDKKIEINADCLRMEQVINNLLDNAFKYTNKGGKIQVVLKKNKETVLTISNTGELILEKEFENIWNSFYQIDTDNQGSGIGLAIVKSIIQLHHYKIQGFTHAGMNHFRIWF